MSLSERGFQTPEERKQSPSEMLVQSGIAERMLETIKKNRGTLDPKITFGVEDCGFRVTKTLIPAENSGTGKKETRIQVVIEMPNQHEINKIEMPRVSSAFAVEDGKAFGTAGEPPLTQEQWDTVQKILKEQEKEEEEKRQI